MHLSLEIHLDLPEEAIPHDVVLPKRVDDPGGAGVFDLAITTGDVVLPGLIPVMSLVAPKLRAVRDNGPAGWSIVLTKTLTDGEEASTLDHSGAHRFQDSGMSVDPHIRNGRIHCRLESLQ